MAAMDPGWYAIDPRRLGWGEVIRIAGWPLLPFALLYRLTGQVSDYLHLPDRIDGQRRDPDSLPAAVRAPLAAVLARLEPAGLRTVAWIGRPRHVSTTTRMQAGGVVVRDDSTVGVIAHVISRHRVRPEVGGARTVTAFASDAGDRIIATTDEVRGLTAPPNAAVLRRRPGDPAGLLALHRTRLDADGRCRRFNTDREAIDYLDRIGSEAAAWRIARGLYRPIGPELPEHARACDDGGADLLVSTPPA